MVLTLSVKHGQSTYQLKKTEDAGVSTLMQDIEELTGVPVRHQKLICQGKVLDTAATLKALKVKNGSKLMLMTSGSQTQVTPALSAVSSFTHKLICCAAIGTSSSPTSDPGQGCSSKAAGRRLQAETEQKQQDKPDTSSKYAGTGPLYVAGCLPNHRVSRLVQDLTSWLLVITAFTVFWTTSCLGCG